MTRVFEEYREYWANYQLQSVVCLHEIFMIVLDRVFLDSGCNFIQIGLWFKNGRKKAEIKYTHYWTVYYPGVSVASCSVDVLWKV